MYFLNVKAGKYNLGMVPNMIIDKHLHSIRLNEVMKELEEEMFKKEEVKYLLENSYKYFGHNELIKMFYDRIDELKSNKDFNIREEDNKKLYNTLEKMKDINYIVNVNDRIGYIIVEQISHWLDMYYEPDYDGIYYSSMYT